MRELDEQASTPLVAPRSRRITVAALLMIFLPPLLPFPLYSLAGLWIRPLESAAGQWCHALICPAELSWGLMDIVVSMGPSYLLAVAAIIISAKWLARLGQHPMPPRNAGLLKLTIALEILWWAGGGGVICSTLGWLIGGRW